MNNIFFIGFMGAGKTTVSKRYAEIHGCEWVELDDEIVKAVGLRIKDIFEVAGEAWFRRVESQILREHCPDGAVISCGGGIVLNPKNVEFMRENGIIIWLDAEVETVIERIKDGSSRPLYNLNNIKEFFEERYEYYMIAGDIRIETDNREIDEICREVYNGVKYARG